MAIRERRGTSGALSVTTGRAISTPPFTGGLFLGQDAVDLLSAGPFAIDHDQRLSVHGSVQYDPRGPLWIAGSLRYDGGPDGPRFSADLKVRRRCYTARSDNGR